jgi:hypothetical protein
MPRAFCEVIRLHRLLAIEGVGLRPRLGAHSTPYISLVPDLVQPATNVAWMELAESRGKPFS